MEGDHTEQFIQDKQDIDKQQQRKKLTSLSYNVSGLQDQDEQVHIINKNNEYKIQKLTENQQFYKFYEKSTLNATIKDWVSDRTLIKLQTHYFTVLIENQKQNSKWEISRRYSDFFWLFNAFKYRYPGCIMPYFPTKSIQNFMVTKLGIKYGEQSKQEHLHLRKGQLQSFINGIFKHQTLSQTEEIKIFLEQNNEEFQKQKKNIQAQLLESQTSESSSGGIVSMFERGMAWITSTDANKSQKQLSHVQGWTTTEQDIKLWIKQFSEIMQKVQNVIQIKGREIQWQGPDTEIDSIQELKAKIMSGRQFNQIFVDQLKQKIIKNIEYQVKTLKQIETQLQDRQNIINIINYIYNFKGDSNRSNKLLRKKQKFQANMIRQWPNLRGELKLKIRNVHSKFNQIWKAYCQRIQKIWKLK